MTSCPGSKDAIAGKLDVSQDGSACPWWSLAPPLVCKSHCVAQRAEVSSCEG